MNIYDVAFFTAFLVCLGIIFFRAWNLFHVCEKADLRITILLFSIFCIAHFVMFSVMMLVHERLIYLIFFQLNTFFMLFNVILLFAEIFFAFGWFSSGGREAFKSSRDNF